MYLLYTHTLYPLQWGITPLHLAARGGHTTCVECLLSIPGIDVNIQVQYDENIYGDEVS